jgi:hypothetical protein
MPRINQHWTVGPHGPVEQIDDGILTVNGELRMPIGAFPRRMTVVALSGGRSAIWSAMALREPEMARVEALGKPAFLIVPSPAHRIDAKVFRDRYPGIKVVTPAGARKAVEQVVPVDHTDGKFDDPTVAFVTVPGTGGKESALLVRRSAGTTLIVNDLIGHVRHPHGLGGRILSFLLAYGRHRPQVPRTIRMFVTDRKALASELRRWGDLPDLRRVIVSHGDPITDDPSGQLRRLAGQFDS